MTVITIPDTKLVNRKYTVYNIEIDFGTAVYKVSKRFSDFIQLKNDLEKAFNDVLPFELPAKTWTKSSTDDSVTEKRRVQLEEFLNDVITDKFNDKWKKSVVFTKFLNLPPGKFNHKVDGEVQKKVDIAWSLTTAGDQVIDDVSQWLSVLRECKAYLEEARKFLHLHNTSECRKNMIVARTKFDGLSKGLEVVSEKQLVGSGEIQRRQNLLDGLKQEYAELEERVSGGQVQKEKLMSGRRVFGRPVETARTRGVDNEELLQMQKQDFKEQDQQLEQLRSIIVQQKGISMAINEELTYQNEMIDSLSSDVDRTGEKLRMASKRAGKFT